MLFKYFWICHDWKQLKNRLCLGHMKKSDTNGFSALLMLLTILVVGGLALSGWYVLRNNNSRPVENVKPSSTPAVVKSKVMKTFNDKLLGYSVQYPEDWTIKTTQGNQGGPEYPTQETILTSAGGTTLSLREDYGGIGGMWQEAQSEKPFAANNVCSSQEIVKLKALNTVTFGEQGQDVPFQVAHINYSPGQTNIVGPIKYGICLMASTSQAFPLEANKPKVGAIYYPPSVTLYDRNGNTDRVKPFYLYGCSSGTTEDFYTSQDGRAIESILESFTWQ